MRCLIVFRTHFWDTSIAVLAERAKASAPSAEFVVATDETGGPSTVEGFQTLPHRDDFSAYSLPALPKGRVLWWNADYVLYAARKARPDFDYYVMLEYDVFVNCDLDKVLAQCAERGVDLVAQDIKRITSENPWFSSISEFDLQPWWALIPFLIVSARAIDVMLQTRQAIAAQLAAGEVSNWPYCETFIPTAILQHSEMIFAQLSDLVDTQLLRFRPYLSTLDPQLNRSQSMAHPVLGGANYIRALTASTPMDALVFPDGRLCHDLQHEDPAELEKEFGAHVAQNQQTKELALVLLPARKPSLSGGSNMIDLAHRKPASQSSHSNWSKGATIINDAAFAVCGILANDYAFHTDLEFDPWWQVDLSGDALIEEIEILNRARPPDRFRSFRIDTSFDGEYWKTQFSKYDDKTVSNDPSKPYLVVFSVPIRARYVRIVQFGHDVMHLRRVRIFGFPLATETTTPNPFPSHSQAAVEILHVP